MPGAGVAPMFMFGPQLMAWPVAGLVGAAAPAGGEAVDPGAWPMLAPQFIPCPMLAPQFIACPLAPCAGGAAAVGLDELLVLDGGWAIIGGLLAQPSAATPPRAAETIARSFARDS